MGLYKLLVLFCFIGGGSLHAKEVVLFENGRQVADYGAKLVDLEVSDVLVFDQGRRYQFQAVLGRGNTTHVLQVLRLGRTPPKPTALRIPLKLGGMPGDGSGLLPYSSFINFFIEGAGNLQKAGLIPEVCDSAEGQWVEVEKINIDSTFTDFLERKPNISADLIKTMESDFTDRFARSLAPFEAIGDLFVHQIVWSQGRWLILDFTGIRLFQGEYSPKEILKKHPMQGIADELFGKTLVRNRLEILVYKAQETIFIERMAMLKNRKNPLTQMPINLKNAEQIDMGMDPCRLFAILSQK
jgi:hypothetical protein